MPTGHNCATGPEDPRLVNTHDGLYLIVTGLRLMPKKNPSFTPKCHRHSILLTASKVETLYPPTFGPPKRLVFKGMGRIEKNWAMFSPRKVEGSKVHAVYSIHPHQVVEVDLATGKVEFIANTTSKALVRLAKSVGAKAEDFHGGAGVAHVRHNHGNYMLSILHVAVQRYNSSYAEYWNYPYKFNPHPPYEIRHIGKKIELVALENPLIGDSISFVSALMVDQDHVLIGYGAGDQMSRTMRMPLDDFHQKYFATAAADMMDNETFTPIVAGSALYPARSSTCSAYLTDCTDQLTPTVCRICHG